MADDSDLPEDRFNALLGRALRREDRDRLAKVRTALGIRANDAVWDVMIALDYHLQLYSAVPKQLAAERQKLVAELGALQAVGGRGTGAPETWELLAVESRARGPGVGRRRCSPRPRWDSGRSASPPVGLWPAGGGIPGVPQAPSGRCWPHRRDG